MKKTYDLLKFISASIDCDAHLRIRGDMEWAMHATQAVRAEPASLPEIAALMDATPSEYRDEIAWQLYEGSQEKDPAQYFANKAISTMVDHGISMRSARPYVMSQMRVANNPVSMARGLMVLACKTNGELSDIVKSFNQDHTNVVAGSSEMLHAEELHADLFGAAPQYDAVYHLGKVGKNDLYDSQSVIEGASSDNNQ